ncbi:MAG: hypothetical protein JWO95_1615 [Verrucomicrobiales bacterium]|nr:hypothetical protein [Verrucomicrobiales bacterium]
MKAVLAQNTGNSDPGRTVFRRGYIPEQAARRQICHTQRANRSQLTSDEEQPHLIIITGNDCHVLRNPTDGNAIPLYREPMMTHGKPALPRFGRLEQHPFSRVLRLR